MKKGILSLLIWSLPLLLMAQNNPSIQSNLKGGLGMTEERDIKWATDTSWQKVKERASAENKYIFIDVFTTWCGPCKRMDKDVYTDEKVCEFFNKNFIAVKLQTDRTEKDDEYVQKWYNYAESILNDYLIDAFPSFLFFSPEGDLVDMSEGFKTPEEFMDLAKAAVNTKETNPYKEYWQLVQDYKQGIKNYDKMPSMIPVAFKFRQEKFAKELMEDHWNYVSRRKPEEQFKKENIQLWGDYFTLKSDGPRFHFFYRNGNRIDEIMGKGYSAGVIDRTIKAEVIDSFFRMQKGETKIITGQRVPNKEVMFMNLPMRIDHKIEPDYQEADWKQLSGMLRKKYDKETVERNVLEAKKRWYQQHQNMGAYVDCNYQLLKNYSGGIENVKIGTVNNDGFYTFKYSTDINLLNIYIEWLEKLGMPKTTNWANGLDTYANLLYKVGRTPEALKYEEKALQIAMKNERYQKDIPNLKKIIEKMKRGEPTYEEEGAIWPKK